MRSRWRRSGPPRRSPVARPRPRGRSSARSCRRTAVTNAFAFPRNFHREICVPPLRLDSRRDLELFVPFSVSDFFSGTESVRNREQMQTLGTAAELVIHLRTFSRLQGGKGKPATPRRARTLRKHRHVTRSPAASHPVVARCTASCRPLPSPPARYASRPRPHLSAKFHRASASSSAEGCESKLPSAPDGFRKRVHRRMRERPRGATGGRAPYSITVDAIHDAGRRVDARMTPSFPTGRSKRRD